MAGVPEYASDDEQVYGRLDNPDPESRDFMYDDIDEFHASREKVSAAVLALNVLLRTC